MSLIRVRLRAWSTVSSLCVLRRDDFGIVGGGIFVEVTASV